MDRKPLKNIGYEYDIDFNSMSDEDIKYFGRQIVKDNVILVRNQTINEERLLYILEQIGNVLKPNQFFMHPDYPGLF